MDKLKQIAKKILIDLGLTVDEDFIENSMVSNAAYTKRFKIGDVTVYAEVVNFGKNCRIDINFYLPEEGVNAQTFMNHCADIEKIRKNLHHEYCYGPYYKDLRSENSNKSTFALSPWHNQDFYVRSEHYPIEDIEEAADNAISLAKQFIRHIPEYRNLRKWNTSDPEVIAKAKEIIANADLQETDCDKEDRAHWLVDKNSFIKGWFYPFADRGNGTFDTNIYGVEYAAKTMGLEGSFEFAVASIVLMNQDYIKKAKKACRIRQETCFF